MGPRAPEEIPLRELLSELLIVVALITVNGVFSGAEIAVIALRRTRLAQLVEDGRPGAKALHELRASPERFLATVQTGITVVGATAAVFGGSELAAELAPALASVPGVGRHAPQLALALVVALVSYLTLVIGELVPKSLALRSAERYALVVARPLLGLAWLARPLVWFLTWSSNALLRPLGDRTNFSEARLSAEELEQLVVEAGQGGALDAFTAEITSRALALRDLTAADVMVPRSRVVALPRDAAPEDIRRLVLEEGRSRMPVYDGTLDQVIGYVMAKDLAAMAWERQLVVLDDLVRPTHFVPESARAVSVLRDLQRRRAHLAVVVDEHGGMAGLLTLEDLIEELVGDILGEEEEPRALFQAEGDGALLVRGDAPIRELNRALGIALPEGDDYTTVGGLCVALAGDVPDRGVRLTAADGTALEIVEASTRVVRRVRLRRGTGSPPAP